MKETPKAGNKPNQRSEARLAAIREEAGREGRVLAPGIRPAGSPLPVASPETGYYGLPLLKPPQWTWEAPVYFFVGGGAGVAAVIAAVAEWAEADPSLVRDAKIISAAGAVLSPVLLISDLGRSSRFLYMLRVFKPQSAMSVGAWTLVFFSSASLASLAAELFRDLLPRFARKALSAGSSSVAGALGLVLSSYTGVLIGATAIPVWNESVGTLPIHFIASGLNTAVALLELAGHEDNALNLLGLSAAVLETAVGAKIEIEGNPALAPLKTGSSGLIVRLGGILSGPLPLLFRLLAGKSKRSRNLRVAAALSSILGSLLTRVGWVAAGKSSAADYRLPLELPPAAASSPAPGALPLRQ